MQFDDSSVDVSGVDDRRGFGGGGAIAAGGGGLGVIGLLVYLVVNVLGGGTGATTTAPGGAAPGGAAQGGAVPGASLPAGTSTDGGRAGETREQLAQRCNSAGALDRYTDCRMIKVYNVADDVWQDEFTRLGRADEYQPPRLSFFTSRVQSGCGAASSAVGPFYCPADQKMYFDLDFLQQLQTRFGASGQFAQAYIVAHEFGHHLQTLSGTERSVRGAQQNASERVRNELSVAMELQADCYAGVWSTLADRRGENGIALSERDVTEAIRAAEAVGDDRIQAKTAGRVDPESWTHGSAQERRTWFLRGLRTADVNACNTFRERGLTRSRS